MAIFHALGYISTWVKADARAHQVCMHSVCRVRSLCWSICRAELDACCAPPEVDCDIPILRGP